MRVGAKALARRDAIFVDNTQRSKLNARRVVIVGERPSEFGLVPVQFDDPLNAINCSKHLTDDRLADSFGAGARLQAHDALTEFVCAIGRGFRLRGGRPGQKRETQQPHRGEGERLMLS